LAPTIEENSGTYQKISGTSMASPQVTGMLALALENYPDMTPTEAKSFITKFSKSTINDTGGSYDDSTSLQGSANRFAYYRKERPDNGLLIPKTVRFIRPDTGVVFPRPQIRKT
jgi:subtilisin family serine protease